MTDGRRSLSLEDCVCPVCLEIYLEPVTLPCTHAFCKSCFQESVDKSTLCCPMCRKRVSTWARHNSRKNTLVNQSLWEQIQAEFPEQCQRRLSGQEAVSHELIEVFPRVSEPGEVRQEYQKEIRKLREEQRQLDEEQRQASEEYIAQLLQEEQQHIQEEQRRKEEDEQVARAISQQLNSPEHRQSDLTPKKVSGLMDRFLFPIPARPATLTSDLTSIGSSHKENHQPPVVDHYAPAAVPQVTIAQRPLLDRNHVARTGERSKRTIREVEGVDSGPKSEPPSKWVPSLPEALAEQEALLLRRREQEEVDRQVALMLQEELDKEQKKDTDRRKGSADAYLLRKRERAKSRTSTPGTSSRGRQTTLTCLFPQLNTSASDCSEDS